MSQKPPGLLNIFFCGSGKEGRRGVPRSLTKFTLKSTCRKNSLFFPLRVTKPGHDTETVI